MPLLSCSSLGLPGFLGSSTWSKGLWLLPISLQSSMHSRACSSSYFFVCCLGRFRRSIIDCSKMFLAVLAVWDKGKENTQKHLSRRKKKLTWCYGYYCKIWYFESLKWPSEQAYLLTELLVLYIHVHSCRTSILFCILTVYKTNWIITKQILIKKRERNF